MLSRIETEILKILEVGKRYSLDDVAKLSKLNKDAIRKAIYLLQSKGYLAVDEVEVSNYLLTEEGKRYLKSGFPEEKLVNILKKSGNVINFKDIIKTLNEEEFKIALGWLKRKGAIRIENGNVVLVFEPKIEEKEGLKLISEGKTVDPKLVRTLIQRKLVRVRKNKIVYVTLKSKPDILIREAISDLTPQILIDGSWREREFLKYDIQLPSREIYGGKVHPYEGIIQECRKIFLEMGFKEIKGHYVQTSFWNFDDLFQPQDHPARDMQDTFYLDHYLDLDRKLVDKVKKTHENGWITGSLGWGGRWDTEKARQLVMRTHTTAVTIHYLAKNPNPPQKAFCIDRVFRREAIDATHLPEFDQLEGVVLDRDVGFRHLLGLLKEFFAKMGFEDIRFRPGYFPYTEPSVEPEVYIDGLGWIELGGAGVFRKEVTEPLGIKGKVLAWGLGIGRLAMLKIGLKDLRKLYLPDINWLRQTPLIKTKTCEM